MGPGDLSKLLASLSGIAAGGPEVLVGLSSADDAGVYELVGHALVATADFITPVCDDPRAFGYVAAANALSDVYAMGGEPLFALNLCCFPSTGVPEGILDKILVGAAEALATAGAALLGGHSVRDEESVAPLLEFDVDLDRARRQVLFDPQTSGGLLLSVPAERSRFLLDALLASGHRAAAVGRVLSGPIAIRVI